MALTGIAASLALLALLMSGAAAQDAEVAPEALLDQETAETEVREELDELGLGLGRDLSQGYGFAVHTDHSQMYTERDDGGGLGLGGGAADGLPGVQHGLQLGLQHGLQHGLQAKQHYVKRVVVTKAVPYSVPQPYTVTLEKRVPYAVKVPVHVAVDKPYEVAVLKPYAVPVDRPVPYAVEKPVPYPVKVAVKVPVAQPVPYEVPKPYTVPVPVVKHYKVAVPVYIKAKEHGVKSDYPHVRYIPQFPSQPAPQPQPAPQQPGAVGGGQAPGEADDDDHHAGYSEQRETFAVLAAGPAGPGSLAGPGDLEARLASLMHRGGSFSYVYRH